MTGPPVVLGSASPRRRELLALIGIAHTVAPADIDETQLPGEPPMPHAERLARQKAMVIAGRRPDALVIGADTIVVLEGAIIGKPVDAADARRSLRLLSGRSHIVFTAVAVAYGGRVASGVEEVAVTFRPLTDETIAAYVATGEPMDKAGAYGIQGFGATIVERIAGDYFAVMGLALGRLIGLMAEVGVRYDFGRLSLTGAGERPASR
jgi:nucleoside triphosphate pyrophosphatase